MESPPAVPKSLEAKIKVFDKSTLKDLVFRVYGAEFEFFGIQKVILSESEKSKPKTHFKIERKINFVSKRNSLSEVKLCKF